MPVFSNFSSGSTQGYGELRTINKIWADNFQRAATVSGLGNSLDGQPWAATRGNWHINTASGAQCDDALYSIASAYTGSINNTQVTMSGFSNGTGVTFWQTDANNWWAASITAVTSGYNYSTIQSVLNPCLTTASGGTGQYTGAAGSCGTYICGSATGVRPSTNNCPCPCVDKQSCGDPYGCVCIGYGGQVVCFSTCQDCTTSCVGATTTGCSCGDGGSYSYDISCNYFYTASGVPTCVGNTNPTCPTGSNNVCGAACVPGYQNTPVTVTGTGIFYQFNLIKSVAGTISNVTSKILDYSNSVTIVSGVLTSTLPQQISVVTSGNIVTANVYNSPNFTNLITTLTTSGSGSLGQFVGIINVPSGSIGGVPIIKAFYSQV